MSQKSSSSAGNSTGKGERRISEQILAKDVQKYSYLCNNGNNVNISRKVSEELLSLQCETLSDLFNQQSETAHPDLPVLNLILKNASQVGLVFRQSTFSLDDLFGTKFFKLAFVVQSHTYVQSEGLCPIGFVC